MFIAEGPGYHENLHGRPFVGRAGKLLDRLLASINHVREDVFNASMVKCRPSGNRDPGTAGIAACTKYLDRQIELINPKLIVTLGRFAFGRYFPGGHHQGPWETERERWAHDFSCAVSCSGVAPGRAKAHNDRRLQSDFGDIGRRDEGYWHGAG